MGKTCRVRGQKINPGRHSDGQGEVKADRFYCLILIRSVSIWLVVVMILAAAE